MRHALFQLVEEPIEMDLVDARLVGFDPSQRRTDQTE